MTLAADSLDDPQPAFAELGYHGPFDLLDPAQLDEAREAFEAELFLLEEAQWAQRHLDQRRVHDLCAHPTLVATAVALLGPDVQLWNSRFRVKGAGAAMIPWHQDDAYWQLDPAVSTVSAWLALDDADEGNGCLEVLPGSHRRARAHHHTEAEVHDDFNITTDTAATEVGTPIPMRAGQVLFFSSKLVHRSGPNRGGSRRAALVSRYAPAGVRFVHPAITSVVVVAGDPGAARHPVVPAPTADGTTSAPADFAFDRPFRGGGWHAAELAPTGNWFRWTGDADPVWLDMEVPDGDGPLEVRVTVLHAMPGALDDLQLVVDGLPLVTTVDGADVVGSGAPPPAGATLRVGLAGLRCTRPVALADSGSDLRPLGIAVTRVVASRG